MSLPSPAGRGSGHAANNFDLIRLSAALLVLISHAWVLTGHPDGEPVALVLRHVTDGGGLAVAVFFVLSGYLIAGSAMRHAPWAYAKARLLRIYPAYVAAVAVQTFVIGAAFSALAAGAYFSDRATWGAVVRAMAFSPPLGLPGVFTDNPVPLAVNGSLWTLRIEVLCYTGLLGLALAGLLRRGRILLPLAAAWGVLAATEAARAGWLPADLASLRVVSIVDCGVHFMMGTALWVYGPAFWRGWVVAAGVAVFGLTAGTRAGPIALHLALPPLVLWLGTVPRWPAPRRDVSYGTYLYAFPVQQALIAIAPGVGPGSLVAMAAPIALLLGWASRRLIEEPALRLRQ